jgi:hypothetical protein
MPSLLLLLLLLILSFPQTAKTTLVVMENLAIMTEKSDLIIHGQVIAQSVKEDTNRRIITTTTLKVLDGMKGSKKGEIKTIYQVGGELDGRVMRITGAHQYRKGEELIFFGLSFGDMVVSYGVGLGKFRVLRDKKNTYVVEDLHDLVAVKSGNGQQIFEEPTPREFPSLDAFKNAIDTALHAPQFQVIQMKPMKRKAPMKKGGT